MFSHPSVPVMTHSSMSAPTPTVITHTHTAIPGLTLYENIITQDFERILLSEIDSQQWDHTLSRRTQQYGFKYEYKKKDFSLRTAQQAPNPPEQLRSILSFFRSQCPRHHFNQVIVNEYVGNQGIGAHTDHLAFGSLIAILSLNEGVDMIFRSSMNKSQQHIVYVPPRSALIMERDARYLFTHEIRSVASVRVTDYSTGKTAMVKKGENWRRVSVTMRTLL